MKVIILGLLLVPIVALFLGVMSCLTEWFGNLCEKFILLSKYSLKKMVCSIVSHFIDDIDKKAIFIAYSLIYSQLIKELFTIEDFKVWKAFI